MQLGVCGPTVPLHPATPIHARLCHTQPHPTLSRGSDSSPPPGTQTTAWYWWDDSKRTCAEAVRNFGPELGATKCCYGWIDTAFFPRHTHAAFARGTVAFWEADYTRLYYSYQPRLD